MLYHLPPEVLAMWELSYKQLGDCPNIETQTLGGEKFWKITDKHNGYVLQRNDFLHHSRILDSKNVRKAWGSDIAMKEKFRRITREEFLEPGDIVGIARTRALKIYDHYAVYLGNGRVIHYAGNNNDFSGPISIHEDSFENFLKQDKDYFVLYFRDNEKQPIKIQSSTNFNFDDSMVKNSLVMKNIKNFQRYNSMETIKRAKSRLGEKNYNLVTNNCEHFAIWCKTNISESYQVTNVFDKVKKMLIMSTPNIYKFL